MAGNQGDLEVQLYLGEIYITGDEIEPDFAEALKWYMKAGKQGSAYGQFMCGIIYLSSEGVKRDTDMGFNWIWIGLKNMFNSVKYYIFGVYGVGITIILIFLIYGWVRPPKFEAKRQSDDNLDEFC